MPSSRGFVSKVFRGFLYSGLLALATGCGGAGGDPVLTEVQAAAGRRAVQSLSMGELMQLMSTHRLLLLGEQASHAALARSGQQTRQATALAETDACVLQPGVYGIYNMQDQMVGVLVVYPDCKTEILPVDPKKTA